MPIPATVRPTNGLAVATALEAYLFLFARFGEPGALFAASAAQEDTQNENHPARGNNGLTHRRWESRKAAKIEG